MGGANKCVFFSSATQTQQCVSFSLADGGLSALSDFRQAGVPIQLRGTIPSKIIVVYMKKAVSRVQCRVQCGVVKTGFRREVNERKWDSIPQKWWQSPFARVEILLGVKGRRRKSWSQSQCVWVLQTTSGFLQLLTVSYYMPLPKDVPIFLLIYDSVMVPEVLVIRGTYQK